METYLNEVVRYLAAQSWQIAVLTVAVAAATFALRRRSAHVRYLLWLIVVAKCLVPPLYVVPLRGAAASPAACTPTVSAEEELGPSTLHPHLSTRIHSASTESVPLAGPAVDGMSAVAVGMAGRSSGAGAGVYLAMNLLRAVRGHCWLRKTRKPLPADVQDRVDEPPGAYGVRRLPTIWIVEASASRSCGVCCAGASTSRPAFSRFESPEHRRDILAHELSHVLRFDAIVNALQVIAQALFWFHPLVWWANQRIRQEREKCCDEMVIARLDAQPKDY